MSGTQQGNNGEFSHEELENSNEPSQVHQVEAKIEEVLDPNNMGDNFPNWN